eukprot:TRINITY_DN16686_c0_g1_i1.p1 TRINITY_DN16686_c0_g1~~TRINITY_DN16686_c0_g1_i1.p1  ORF type:complete len:533 (+),score=91.80 TRINITY_DN16686_c0_g1_i1:87-1685(+)
MEPSSDPWSILGIDRGSDEDEIKKAFKRLARLHHPDKNGDAVRFKEVHEAYQTLLERGPEEVLQKTPSSSPMSAHHHRRRNHGGGHGSVSLKMRRLAVVGMVLFVVQMVSVLSTNTTTRDDLPHQVQVKGDFNRISSPLLKNAATTASPEPSLTPPKIDTVTRPPIPFVPEVAEHSASHNMMGSSSAGAEPEKIPVAECHFGSGWETDITPMNISSSQAHLSVSSCRDACDDSCYCWSWQQEGECLIFNDPLACVDTQSDSHAGEDYRIFGLKNCQLTGCNFDIAELPQIDDISSPTPYCARGSFVPYSTECYLDVPLFECNALTCSKDTSADSPTWNEVQCAKLCPPLEGFLGCGYEPQPEGFSCTPHLKGYSCVEHICVDGEFLGSCIENGCPRRQLAIQTGVVADGCDSDSLGMVRARTICAFMKLGHTCDTATCTKGVWSTEVITCRPDSCLYPSSFPLSETPGCSQGNAVPHGTSCHYQYCTPVICELGSWTSKPECEHPPLTGRGRSVSRGGRGRGRGSFTADQIT